jgi:hypothetical protein
MRAERESLLRGKPLKLELPVALKNNGVHTQFMVRFVQQMIIEIIIP